MLLFTWPPVFCRAVNSNNWTAVLLFAILAGGALYDLKTGRIPNWWIAAGAAGFVTAGFIRASPIAGEGFPMAVFVFLFRLLCITAVLFPLFLFRMMGAGDIKMMALVGGYLGISQGIRVIFYGLAAFAVWSVFYMIQQNILKKRMVYFFSYAVRFFRTGQVLPYYRAGRDDARAAFCFVPFLWCGFCIWLAG